MITYSSRQRKTWKKRSHQLHSSSLKSTLRNISTILRVRTRPFLRSRMNSDQTSTLYCENYGSLIKQITRNNRGACPLWKIYKMHVKCIMIFNATAHTRFSAIFVNFTAVFNLEINEKYFSQLFKIYLSISYLHKCIEIFTKFHL